MDSLLELMSSSGISSMSVSLCPFVCPPNKFQTIVSYIYCNRFTTYCNDYPYFH